MKTHAEMMDKVDELENYLVNLASYLVPKKAAMPDFETAYGQVDTALLGIVNAVASATATTQVEPKSEISPTDNLLSSNSTT
jgi:hypothetical protein